MANYLFVYHGGRMPETPEEGAKVMQQWTSWMGGLGDAMVNPGNAVGKSKTLTGKGVLDNGGANPVMGFSVVKADSMDAAIKIARGCPHMDYDGTIEIAEAMDM